MKKENLYNEVSWGNSDLIVSTLKKSVEKVVHYNKNTHILIYVWENLPFIVKKSKENVLKHRKLCT